MTITKSKWSLSVLILVIGALFISLASYVSAKLLVGESGDHGLEQEHLFMIDTLFYSLAVVALVAIYVCLLKQNLLVIFKSKKLYMLFVGGMLLCVTVSWIRELLLNDGLGNIYDIKIKSFKLLYAVLIAVLFEELLFRKYLVELGQGLGLRLWLSCLISAILFALWHTTAIEDSWFLIFSGLLYSYLTYLFGSIAFAIGLHSMLNIFVVFVDAGAGSGAEVIMSDAYQDVSIDSGVSSVRFDLSCLAVVLIFLSIVDKIKGNRQTTAC
jgi:membrane protease YdiL (CAAX protease family)